MVSGQVEPREVHTLTVPPWGRVAADPVLCWVLLGADGTVVPEVRAFMAELAAAGCSPSTRRSYCFDLLRWWRFCATVEVPWQAAGREEVRDFVRWLQSRPNPQRRRRPAGPGGGRPAPGTVNIETGKAYLPEGYAPRTINHALSVVSAFYTFAYQEGLGPLRNPVPPGQRPASGLPLRRAVYRQREPVTQPRAISEELLQRLFAVLVCDRDKAMVATALSSGVRASELLSMTRRGVDPGQGVLSVIGKGRAGARVWVPAAPQSFVWIARYLSGQPVEMPEAALWVTRRAPHTPLTYFGLRQVLERANAALDTNLTWHDFRHTFAHRLLADERMTLTDTQMLLRHRHVTTVQAYATSRLEELVSSLHRHLTRPEPVPPMPGPGFAAADLHVLFPGMGL